MITQFLLVSGWLFWAAIAAAFLVVACTLRDDEGPEFGLVLATTALGLTVAFTDAFDGARVRWLIVLAAAYFVAGVLWAFKKWYSFLVKKLADYRTIYDRPSSTPNTKTFSQYAEENRPLAADNKARITGWMLLWPWSFSWWVMTWPRRAFVWAYERLSTVFDRISAHVFARAAG